MNPELLAELAASTETAVVQLVERWEAGELTDEQFAALATAAIARGQSAATALADLGVATAIGVSTVGLLRDAGAVSRAAAVAREVLSTAPRVAFGIGFNPTRMLKEVKEPGHDREWYRVRNQALKFIETAAMEARAEVLGTAQVASRRAIRAHGAGWVRKPNSGACEVCTSLRNDQPIPADTPMWTHKGCGCTQKPLNRKEAA